MTTYRADRSPAAQTPADPPRRRRGAAPAPAAEPLALPPHAHAKRIGIAAVSTVVAVNIWTGGPLLALWIGSRFVDRTRLSMGAVVIVVIALAAIVYSLVMALTWLSAAYDRLDGVPEERRRTAPWLRSMRAERLELTLGHRRVNAVERVVVLSVGACALCFNVWFFFLAGSPLAGT